MWSVRSLERRGMYCRTPEVTECLYAAGEHLNLKLRTRCVTARTQRCKIKGENDVDMMYAGIWRTLHEAHVLLSKLSS